MDRIQFTGIMPALVTPVNPDGSIRKDVTRSLIKDLSATGITGFYILGGTGEGVTIDRNIRMEFAELVKECTPKGIKIINHIASGDIASLRMLAKHSREIGIDGLASVPPFFYQYDEKGVIEYYTAMSEASDGLPMLVYASPLAGPLLAVETIGKMLSIPGFMGMKFTNPNYYLMSRYKKLDGGNINIINGPDEMLTLGLQMGADGGIGSTYNVMPRSYVKIYDAVKSGDMQAALAEQNRVNDVIEVLIRDNKVIAAVKAALEIQGYDVGSTNRPMPELTEEERARLERDLKALGFPETF